MQIDIDPSDIDSKEKAEAFKTLHGEDAYEELTAEPEEAEEDELPDDAVTREEWQAMPPERQKEVALDEDTRIVPGE